MHDNTLLFMRVGLNPTALQNLSTLVEDKKPSIRACQLWFNGERTPKNGMIDIAHRLDNYINKYAFRVIHKIYKSNKKEIWVMKFKNDDELWTNHSTMFGLNNGIHSALINRIIIVGMAFGINVYTQPSNTKDTNCNHKVDWNSCASVWIETEKILSN